MAQLIHRIGDATQPVERPALIAHVCNDRGMWGKGFVLALSARYPSVEREYRTLAGQYRHRLPLGMVQVVEVARGLAVANMVAMSGIRTSFNPEPLQYPALVDCLTKVIRVANATNADIHMPRIGAGLAGGCWGLIERLIMQALQDSTSKVVVYTKPD